MHLNESLSGGRDDVCETEDDLWEGTLSDHDEGAVDWSELRGGHLEVLGLLGDALDVGDDLVGGGGCHCAGCHGRGGDELEGDHFDGVEEVFGGVWGRR